MSDVNLPLLITVIDSFLNPYLYEDDDDELVSAFLESELTVNRIKRIAIPRCQSFVERIIPALAATEFQSHFRMLPQTFQLVLQEIQTPLRRNTFGNEMISPEKQLLITLWRLATPDSYRSIHTKFGVGKATAVRAVRRVIHALCGLAPKVIQWPTGEKINAVVQGFCRAGSFPQTIGAIDGTYINIPAPKENPNAYVNRKGHHSIHAQVVCDHMRLFTHMYVGNVGSVHDARALRLSIIQDYLNDPTKFPNDTHLIGDAAYPLAKHLMVPYTDNGHLSERQKNYNFCLSSTRMTVEKSIGLLKMRWRSLLHHLAVNSVERVSYHVMACCVLHNMCLMNNDDLGEVLVGNCGIPHRGQAVEQPRRVVAEAKRNLICETLTIRDV